MSARPTAVIEKTLPKARCEQPREELKHYTRKYLLNAKEDINGEIKEQKTENKKGNGRYKSNYINNDIKYEWIKNLIKRQRLSDWT